MKRIMQLNARLLPTTRVGSTIIRQIACGKTWDCLAPLLYREGLKPKHQLWQKDCCLSGPFGSVETHAQKTQTCFGV